MTLLGRKSIIAAAWTVLGVAAIWLPRGVITVATGFMLASSVAWALDAIDSQTQSMLLRTLLANRPAASRERHLHPVQSAEQEPTRAHPA